MNPTTGIRMVNHRAWLTLTALVVSVLSASCTTLYEGKYDFYEGWRKAEITRIDALEKLSPFVAPRCPSAPSEGAATWAIVRYRLGGRSRFVAGPVPTSDEFMIGEQVYVKVSECAREIRKRSTSAGTPP